MLKNGFHRLLKRQLEKSGLNMAEDPKYAEFLNVVNDAYKSFDKDVKHIENILEESSKELFVAHQKLMYERDHTKAKLENIINNIGGVIFETDLEGNFTFLNDAWEEYSNYSLKNSIGKNFKDFLKQDRIDGSRSFEDIFYNKDYITFIFKNRKDRMLNWFEVKAKLVKDINNLSTGFIGTAIDITNLKETEIELQKASQAKDEFLSTMSHEIRTPLNAVTGLTNILLMDEYLPEQLENLKALKYSGEHLLGLINDLLDFNKIKSGKLKVSEDDFSLNHFLENIRLDFEVLTQNKGIAFNIIKGENVLDSIIGDKLKLAQVIKNLLSNALKFIEKGSITLCVNNLGRDKNKIRLEFKVTDTGIGISKDRQDSIFESFMQASSQTSVKYGGTGLGLSISKSLLKLQGSDLKVESELGKGATFSFEIDYKVSNRLSVFKPDMVKTQLNYKPLNVNVLVAEDNKMNVLILKKFFSKWHVNFKIAENGEEVLQHIEHSNVDFDVILMDLQMPRLDGYETTKIIRKSPDKTKANIPIIALTAFAQTDIKEKAKSYKMNGFMGKPFNPEKLYLLLKSYNKIVTS